MLVEYLIETGVVVNEQRKERKETLHRPKTAQQLWSLKCGPSVAAVLHLGNTGVL